MTDTDFESSLTQVFRQAAIGPSDDAVRRVLEADRGRHDWRRPLVLSVAALCVAAIAVATVPSARAGLREAFGAVGDFIHSDSPAPGPSIAKVSHPGWVNDLPAGHGNGPAPPDAHVLATAANGERLLAYRDSADPAQICFLYGSFGGECRKQSDPILKSVLADEPLGLLARSTEADGAIAIWGLVAEDVVSVRVNYADGSTQTVPAKYGFITPGSRSAPTTVQALDRQGKVVARADPADPLLTQCDVSACGVALQSQDG